jgi:predicted ATP-grasp superfamily ATP-dependent carboligase
MRVFVYEHTCARPGNPSLAALRAEGWAMLSALLADFGRTPHVETITLPDAAGEGPAAFRELARSADWTVLIAPECDGLLAERCRWVEEAGGRLLGPSSAAVRLSGDKLLLAEHLRAAGVPTPPCVALAAMPVPFPAVCKPRDGAGSRATFLVRGAADLARCRAQAAAEGWRGELLLQPFVPGLAASVAFLIGPGRCMPLPPARQFLSGDGRFHYLGGRLPLSGELGERTLRLARRAVETVHGLRGYVGVDVVLGDEDQVIEINPRLTTSYVGLRALAETNLAEAMVNVATGEEVPLRWRAGEVCFRADGRVEPRAGVVARRDHLEKLKGSAGFAPLDPPYSADWGGESGGGHFL